VDVEDVDDGLLKLLPSAACKERSDEWKVVSYVGRRYVRGAKRAQKRVSLNS